MSVSSVHTAVNVPQSAESASPQCPLYAHKFSRKTETHAILISTLCLANVNICKSKHGMVVANDGDAKSHSANSFGLEGTIICGAPPETPTEAPYIMDRSEKIP